MNKPKNYDEVEAKKPGEYDNPPAGGYVLICVGAKETTSKAGAPMLTLSLDIAEGKYMGHYKGLSEKQDSHIYLMQNQLLGEANASFLKGLITSFEESNPGFKFDFNEKTLIGKRVGANLREEEYVDKKGQIRASLKIVHLCSIESVKKGLPVLARKTLDGKPPVQTSSGPTPEELEQTPPF